MTRYCLGKIEDLEFHSNEKEFRGNYYETIDDFRFIPSKGWKNKD